MSNGTQVAKVWAVGVDLNEHHLGPPRFVAALMSVASRDTAIGIHVMLAPELLDPFIAADELRKARERIGVDLEQMLERAGLQRDRSSVELVEDGEVDRGLAECATRRLADVLVLGRRARRDEDSLVRLGDVTRRLLRRLPLPLVVVPPDFGDPGDRGFGDGPIIVGVDLSHESIAAVRFATDLAAQLGRPLLLAHGIQAFHWGVSYVPVATIEQLRTQARDEAAGALREWAASHGFGDAQQRVFMGDPANQLLEMAVDEDAAMLVTGSRMLGVIERLFLASVSTEVAAGASCPVAVVPGK